MKFINPLPFVADIARAKAFYTRVMGLKLCTDHGEFVQFSNGFALHDGASLYQRIYDEAPANLRFGQGNLVLYFEVPDLERECARIAGLTPLIHAITCESWGGRVFRLHDPDGHVIEVGEADLSTDQTRSINGSA